MSEQSVSTYKEIYEQQSNYKILPWFQPVRDAAWKAFNETGFPDLRNEDWKYTNINSIAKKQFAFPDKLPLQTKDIPDDVTNISLTFINHDLSVQDSVLSSKITANPLSAVTEYTREKLLAHWQFVNEKFVKHFNYLNLAILDDALVLSVDDQVVVEEPIYINQIIDQLSDNFIDNKRLIIMLGKNSKASLIEQYTQTEKTTGFQNLAIDILLDDNAIFEHVKLIDEQYQSKQVANTFVSQSKSSKYNAHFFALGGKLVRNDINSLLMGERAEIDLNGLYLVDGKRHVDMHTTVVHNCSHAESAQFYKGVLADKGRAVFNGKIIVDKNTVKTNSSQQNHNLLLSDTAEIDTKPELQIFADDVKAAHGASIGELNQEALFYFQARGISLETAKSMLLFGYCKEVVDKLESQQLKQVVLENVLQHFANYETLKSLMAV